MLNRFPAIIFLALFSSCLFGQTKAETIDFIVQELKSCQNGYSTLKDVEFSDSGTLCKIKIASPGLATDISLELYVPGIDVFSSTKIHKLENNEYVYTYSLIASPRTEAEGIKKNMSKVHGSEIIIQNVLNGQKIKQIEAAFVHLNNLLTGRPKFL